MVRSESVRNMIRERRMLEHLNHPFLCNLRYSFQDVEYLYVVRQSDMFERRSPDRQIHSRRPHDRRRSPFPHLKEVVHRGCSAILDC